METPIIIGQSELINRVIMERDRMQEVGRVERLWMYPQAHRVMGVICRTGRFRSKRWVYKLPQLDSLGQGTLWVNGDPTETTEEQIQRLESLMDHEVWVDGGDRLGTIIDCLFNRKTGAITQYLLINGPLNRWVGDPLTLSPSEIKGFGNQRVLVDERSLQRLKRERPSLKDTWNNLQEQAQTEYDQLTQDVQSAQKTATQRAEELRQQAGEQAQTWGKRFSSRAQTWRKKLGEQTRELSQEFSEEFKTQAADWQEQTADWREKAADWREQVNELRAGEWGEAPRVEAPEEVTWVDEAGDLPPTAPSSRSSPRSRHRPAPRPSPRPRGRYSRERTETNNERWVSRDNPWGYQEREPDEATTPSPSHSARSRSAGSRPDPSRSRHSPQRTTEDFQVPEDVQDDDPWV